GGRRAVRAGERPGLPAGAVVGRRRRASRVAQPDRRDRRSAPQAPGAPPVAGAGHRVLLGPRGAAGAHRPLRGAVRPAVPGAPGRPRAEAALDCVGPLVAGLEEARSPLDLIPGPGSLAARLFPRDALEAQLDTLIAAQGEDGGWPVPREVWTPAAGPEWRAWI